MRGTVRGVAALAVLCMSTTGPSAGAAPPRPAPGDQVLVASGQRCTLGFLLRDDAGRQYMSTAGHCVIDEGEPRRWPDGRGPEATLSVPGRPPRVIGRVVFAERTPKKESSSTYDFAVIKLAAGVHGDPEVRGIGGPSGVNDERSQAPAVLRFYGQGNVVGGIRPARELLAPNLRHPDFVYAHGPATFGDSGGPVIDEHGRAVGTVQGAAVGAVGPDAGPFGLEQDTAPNIIVRIAPALERASLALRRPLRLMTQ